MDSGLYVRFAAVESQHWWFRARQQIVLAVIDKILIKRRNEQLRVLDVGCGTGAILNKLRAYGQVWGVDPSKEALAFAQEVVPGDVKLLQGSLPSNLPQQKYDLICVLDVLEHVDEDELALENLFERLDDAGWIIITVPAFRWLWSSQDDHSHHHRRYSLKELRTIIEKAGLKVSFISYYNFFLFPILAIFKVGSRMLGYDKPHVNSATRNMFSKILERVFSAEKHWLLSGKKFPFGISIIAMAEKK